jgi:hypothetical protein
VGNHGAYEPVVDPSSNYFFNAGISGITSPFDATGTRTTPQDASFSQIEEVSSGATSNDNTLAVSLQHNSKYLTVQANYTWQHALDEISNGRFPAVRPEYEPIDLCSDQSLKSERSICERG